MTALDPASQLTALIRVQLASLKRRGVSAPATAATPAAGGAGGSRDVAALVADRLRAIAREDAQGERKALRLFLESVLMAELGESLVADPMFTRMVDHVQQQMEADPALAAASREAARLLLDAARGG